MINKNKLPIKYILNIYKMLEDCPSSDDILYEMCLDEEILNGKEIGINYIKHLLTSKIELEKLEEILNILIDNNFLTIINKKYKLINHPWG